MERHVTLIRRQERKTVEDDYTYLENLQPLVYLSGPMEHVSEEEGRGWREEATTLLAGHEIESVNPYDVPRFDREETSPKLLVKADLHWILRSQGMIINASQDIVTWGTPMEVIWAHMHRTVNVAFVGELIASPWLAAHARIVPTLEQAVEVMAWEIRQL